MSKYLAGRFQLFFHSFYIQAFFWGKMRTPILIFAEIFFCERTRGPDAPRSPSTPLAWQDEVVEGFFESNKLARNVRKFIIFRLQQLETANELD